MDEQRRYETATTMPMVEEEITPRNTDSLNAFAFLSAREGSKYLGLLFLGVGFAYVGAAYRILWLFLPAMAFSGFGAGGLLVLYQQLERYKDQPKTKTVRKYMMQAAPEERPYARVTAGAKTEYMPLKRLDVTLQTGTGGNFVFTGRNLDRLYQWMKSYDTSLRKVGNENRPGFDQLPDKITSEAYTAARKALLYNEYISDTGNGSVWTSAGMEWLEKAGVK